MTTVDRTEQKNKSSGRSVEIDGRGSFARKESSVCGELDEEED